MPGAGEAVERKDGCQVLVKQWKGRTGASAGEAVERKDGCQCW